MKPQLPLCDWHSSQKVINPQWAQIVERLLHFGGTGVVRPDYDSHIAKILNHGQVHHFKQIKRLGRPSECHANSAELWMRSEGQFLLCTGYALAECGLWHQHSWCETSAEQQGQVILETTDVEWQKHYGVALDEQEAFMFVMANIKPQKALFSLFEEMPLMCERLKRHLPSKEDESDL